MRPGALKHLGVYLYTDLEAGPAPSKGLLDELKSLMADHADKIRRFDERAAKKPEPAAPAPAKKDK